LEIYQINKINIHSIEPDELGTKLSHVLLSKGKPRIVTTFNLDFLRISEKNKDFLHICKNSLWNLPDGMGITSLIRFKYKKKIQRITGNDIFPTLLALANKHLLKVALVGSCEDVLVKVREKIESKYNNLNDRVLCISPPFQFEEKAGTNNEIIQSIQEFKSDIVLAALGCPRQEIWLWNHMNEFDSKINIGVGAVFDFYSGIKKRCPRFLQKVGLEWLWRMFSEPRRLFKRYMLLDLPYLIKNLLILLLHKIKIN